MSRSPRFVNALPHREQKSGIAGTAPHETSRASRVSRLAPPSSLAQIQSMTLSGRLGPVRSTSSNAPGRGKGVNPRALMHHGLFFSRPLSLPSLHLRSTVDCPALFFKLHHEKSRTVCMNKYLNGQAWTDHPYCSFAPSYASFYHIHPCLLHTGLWPLIMVLLTQLVEKVFEAIDMLQGVSVLFLHRLEDFADDCEAMAVAGVDVWLLA
jgi:hypothetical protein